MAIARKISVGHPPQVAPSTLKRVTVLATLGNVLEWYDFTVYGFLAVYIGAAFFPAGDGVTATLATFAVFGVGFVGRPLGSLVLGPVIDRKGRKSVMLLSMLLMAAGSLLIGIAPGYAVAGALGAVVIVIGRLLQGLSAGGEFGSSAVFLVEWAHQGRRGFFGSFHQVATYGGLLLGVLVTAGLSSALGTSAMHDWGWRIPFLLGALLAVVVLFLRRRMEETPIFSASLEGAVAESGAYTRSVKEPRPIVGFLLTVGVVSLWGVTAMVALTYMPSYASEFLGIDLKSSLWATLIGAMLTVVLLPIAGHLSDKVGRKTLIVFGAVGYLVVTYPLFVMMSTSKTFGSLMVTQVVLAVFTAAIAGVGSATITELFSAKHRGFLVSIASATAVTLFGGFGAMICTWLIDLTGSMVSPAFYIVGVAMVTLVAGFFLPKHLASAELRR
jgi:MFS transporter, MHS family, proline/betaine transporter